VMESTCRVDMESTCPCRTAEYVNDLLRPVALETDDAVVCPTEDVDARLRVQDFALRSDDLGNAPHTCYLGREKARWLLAAEVQGYY